MGRRGTGLAALLVAVTTLTSAGLTAGATPSMALGFADAGGLHVVSSVQVDERQYDVTLLTDAIGQPLTVRLLLPVGYDGSSQRYPVLYLYTGTGGSHVDWVDQGDADGLTADLPLITVMPDVGLPGQTASSFFVDWHDPTTQWGPSRWETFQVDQLIPWVDANLRTIASRDGRAVAGLSQGGYGSMVNAVRNPDQFTSVASLSGLAAIDTNPSIAATATVFVAGISAANGVGPDTFLGSRLTDQANWMGHDPGDLVENYRDLDVWLFTGNGVPGPLDAGPPEPAAMAIEVLAHTMTTAFVDRAAAVGLPIHFTDYGPGTHTFPYWTRDLDVYLDALMARFAAPPAAGEVGYESVDREWTQWGWNASFERGNEQELSRLSAAGPAGFTLQGTGTATVRTPPVYEPGSSASLTIDGSPLVRTVDDAGSLTIELQLGGTPTDLVPGVPDDLASAGSSTVAIAAVPRGGPSAPQTDVAASPAATRASGALPTTGGSPSRSLITAGALLAAALLVRRPVRGRSG